MVFEKFNTFFQGAAGLFKGWTTPLSGQKRNRDDSETFGEQPQRKVQANRKLKTDASKMQNGEAAQKPAGDELPQSYDTPSNNVLFAARTAGLPSNATFTLGGRVRELTPRQRAGVPAVNGGFTHGHEAIVDDRQQQQQQLQEQQRPNAGVGFSFEQAQAQRDPVGSSGTAASSGTSVANLFVFGRPPPASKPNGVPQSQPRHAGGVVPQPAAPRGLLASPETGQGYSPAGYEASPATQRQLFATPAPPSAPTPGSTLGQRLRGLQLETPAGRAAAAPAAGAAAAGSNYSRLRAPGPATRPAAPAAPAAAAPLVPFPGTQTPQLRFWQLPQPQPQPGFPFQFTAMHMELSSSSSLFSADRLRELLAQHEAFAARRPRSVSVREDGGFIHDAEEADNDVAVKAQQARATHEQLKNSLKNLVRAANAKADPRVVGAASGGAAARASLAVSQAVAGRETVEAAERKVAAHDAEVQRVRQQAEASTRQQVEAVKSAANFQRSQREQQLREQQQRLRQAAQPTVDAAAAGPSTAAAGPSGRGAAATHSSGRGPARRGRPPPPQEEEDGVVDLLSSSDEEEEEEEPEEEEGSQAGEQEEGAGPGEEDETQYGIYGVPYGQYGDERRGTGNSALRFATAAERATWRRVMDRRQPADEQLLSFRANATLGFELSREKLQCMEVATWLNDEAINLYMVLLQQRDLRMRNRRAAGGPGAAAGGGGPRPFPKCHFFNSFFYNKLYQDAGEYNYQNVRRWTTTKRLESNLQASPTVLELDRIIMPIHKGVHWTCAVVDLRERAVRYYDSLLNEDHALVKHLLAWVRDESQDKLRERWDTSDWRVEFPKDIPEQTNGCDCGVFTIMFADRLGAGRPLDFRQADMNLLRVQVLHRLVTNTVP